MLVGLAREAEALLLRLLLLLLVLLHCHGVRHLRHVRCLRRLLLLLEERGQLAGRRAAAPVAFWRAGAVGAAAEGRRRGLRRHQRLVVAVHILAAVRGQQGHGKGQLDGRRAALRRLRTMGRAGEEGRVKSEGKESSLHKPASELSRIGICTLHSPTASR